MAVFFFQGPTNWRSRSEKEDLKEWLSLIFTVVASASNFKVSIWKLSRVANLHRPIAEFLHPLQHYQLYLKKNKQTNPRILPNLCLSLQCLKRSCLELSNLPLSQEGAFSPQLQKLLYCKAWFNLELRSPAHLQCKLTCQTAFCEGRRGHSSALPTVLRGQQHLAQAEQAAGEVMKRSHSKVHEISVTNGIRHNLQFILLQCAIKARTTEAPTWVLENHNEKQITRKVRNARNCLLHLYHWLLM